jgi:protein-tyrosine-phosphatase
MEKTLRMCFLYVHNRCRSQMAEAFYQTLRCLQHRRGGKDHSVKGEG